MSEWMSEWVSEGVSEGHTANSKCHNNLIILIKPFNFDFKGFLKQTFSTNWLILFEHN